MANIWISNGTCYTSPGTPTDVMIPCGNAYFGHTACCQASDTCLSSSVCYNNQFGTTYVTGCTDPDYSAAVCPNKFGDGDAPWLGMSYCNGTSNEWVLCDQHDHPATLQTGDPCWCPTAAADRAMTLSEPTAIVGTASLPSATGLSIAWAVGFYPTAPGTGHDPTAVPATGTATTSSSAAAAAAATSAVSSTSSPPSTVTTDDAGAAVPSYTREFSTGAKIGTAIGASVLGLLLLALLGLFIVRRRRRKQQLAQTIGDDDKPPGGPQDPSAIVDSSSSSSSRHEVSHLSGGGSPHASMVSELDNKAARPWSAVSELEGARGGVGVAGAGGGAGGGSERRMEAIAEATSSGRALGCEGHGGGGGGGGGRWGRREEAGVAELEAPRGAVELPA